MFPFETLGSKAMTWLTVSLYTFQMSFWPVLLPVPFVVQAPEANWNQPWQDACEETSLLMVDAFYGGQQALSLEESKQGILGILALKEKTMGPSEDESVSEVASLAQALHSDWKPVLQDRPTIEQMKAELKAGHPILAPMYAPELSNPYYSGEGPDYHMVVIVGYDSRTKTFILHDPGTSQGKALHFDEQLVMEAIHDLNLADYAAGAKRVLFTSPVD